MVCSQHADGGDSIQIWKVSATTMKSSSGGQTRGGPPQCGLCRAKNSPLKCYEILHGIPDLASFVGMT
jgi:hypothetical protein